MSRAAATPAGRSPDGDDTAVERATDEESVSTDDAFELLSNQRRRFVLHHLEHNDHRAELGTLSEHVASWETETTLSEVDSTERKRVYTSLQSHHLPKMDSEGIVDYDERDGVVELTEQGADLDVYLEIVEGRDVPWSHTTGYNFVEYFDTTGCRKSPRDYSRQYQYYLGLASVNLGLIAAAAVGAWPLHLLPDIAWGAFVGTTVFVSALVHIYHDTSQQLGEHTKPPEIRDR